MSFANLGTPPGAKTKPRSYDRGHDSSEGNIKSRIESLQDCSRSAREEMDRLERGLSTADFPAAAVVNRDLDNLLARMQKNVRETEQLFRDWTVQMAGDPAERHRKRFVYEKLQKAFEEETAHHDDIRSRASILQQRAASAAAFAAAAASPVSTCPATPASEGGEATRAVAATGEPEEDEGVVEALDEDSTCDKEDSLLLLDVAPGPPQDAGIMNMLSQEREEGIRRIQNQVSQVNQMFRDLASIVVEQGEQLNTIEGQAECAKESTADAAKELQKTMKRQGSMRDRLLIFLVLVVIFMCFIVVPHIRPDAGMASVPAPVKEVVHMSAEPGLPMAPIFPTRKISGAGNGFLTKGPGKVPALATSRAALL